MLPYEFKPPKTWFGNLKVFINLCRWLASYKTYFVFSQKGVEVKKYYIKYVNVLTPYMGSFQCRAYTQKVIPLPRGDNDEIPVERWPSWTYKEIMILGATEHVMPEYYIRDLKKLKHNGEEGALRTVCLLIRYANNEPCECRVPGRIPRKPLKLDLKKLKEEKDIQDKK